MAGNDRVDVEAVAAVRTASEACTGNADGAEQSRLDFGEIRAWLMSEVATLVHASPDEIDVLQPFVHYGIGSAQALELAAKLEDWIGFPVTPTLVWDYPNIEALARHLAETVACPEAADLGEDR